MITVPMFSIFKIVFMAQNIFSFTFVSNFVPLLDFSMTMITDCLQRFVPSLNISAPIVPKMDF